MITICDDFIRNDVYFENETLSNKYIEKSVFIAILIMDY